MTFTTCFWTLLSQKDLSFIYLSPWLSKALGPQHDLLLGTSFFDYFHPEEQELARRDLFEFVKKKTLTCSVTRCQYNTIQTIRKKLQKSSPKSLQQMFSSQYSPVSSTMTSPNFPPTVLQTNDEYIIMDVGMNVVSQDIVLACFHSDDVKQSNSNCVPGTCGETEFTKEEVNKLSSLMHKHMASGFSKVQTPPSTPFSENSFKNNNNETPNRIFQILDRKSRNLIFTWPDPNSTIRQQYDNNNLAVDNSISDVSYNKDDFSRLLQDVIMESNNNNSTNTTTTTTSHTSNGPDKKPKNSDVESPNCLKPVSDKHILLLASGTYRQVESVVMPYGDIIFACFQILPPSSSKVSLVVSSAFTKPKSRSAPCSPATTINGNGMVKRPRSPGSLSPLPSYHSGDAQHYHHSNPQFYPQEVPEFILDHHRSKKHRIEPPTVSISPSTNDSTVQHSVPVKISSSPMHTPHLLLNPISSPYHNQPPPPPPSQPQSQPQPYYPPPTQQPSSQQQQQDYSSPTNPPQFFSSNSNLHMIVQPSQPPTSQSPSTVVSSNQPQQRFAQFAPQQRRNNGNNNLHGIKKCESCHTSSSPEWRRGPTGHKTLCNACGLRYSRTIARENRKREQAQREQEQRQREQREREERARERAAAMMMQRVIDPYPQYRPSNQHQHHHTSGPQLFHTLPPLNPPPPHHHHQPSPQPPQVSHHHQIHPTQLPLNHHHHHHHHQQQHHQIDLPPPTLSASNNDRVGFTLPPPNFSGASNGSYPTNGIVKDRRDPSGDGERYTTAMTVNMMNNVPQTPYPNFGRAQ